MTDKPTYEELEQRVKELNREVKTYKNSELEGLSHLRFLEIMDKIDQVIRGSDDIDEIMRDVLETVLTIFQCDRVWLLYPCDPEAAFWRVPMECTRPEYPGAFELNQDIPMTSEMVESFKAVLKSKDPLVFHPEHGLSLPDSAKQFSIQSSINNALYPKVGRPWMWGLSQCSHARQWTEEETSIFQEIGRRLSDSLSILLTLRNLRESEGKYRLLAENVTDVIWTMDMNMRFTYYSPSIEQLQGYTPEEAMARTLQESLTADSLEKAIKVFNEEFEEHNKGERDPSKSITLELEVTCKDGTTKMTETQTNFTYDLNGHPIGVIGVTRDITNRKRAEEALRESQKRYMDLIENAVMGIYQVTKEGQFIMINQRMANIFGFLTSQEFLANIDNITKLYIRPEERPKILQEINAKGFIEGKEVELKKKDNKSIWVKLYSRGAENKDGVIFYEGLIEDITERKALEEQLRQSHKMEAIGTLAGGIAHDFNNILGIILGNTELALDDVPEWNPVKYNLGEIKTASLRAKDVVRQLLSFARKTKLEKKPTNITPIVKESLRLLRSSIPTSIEIRQNITRDVDIILADPTQINQILINLCTNADHAMPDGGIIVVTLKNIEFDKDTATQYADLSLGRYVSLTVSDTGHGISKEEIDRIYDPYFTTKEVGKGTGMGLAVVHGIVNGHNGKIIVESEIGKGTNFTIFFPVVKKDAVVEIETVDKIPVGNESILFVDDEKSIVDMTRKMLERLGYQVESRMSPIEALELFKSIPDQFDLVITDMTMPQMSGVRLSEELKAVRSDIPIIISTGYSSLIDEEKSKKLGIDAYVMKPIVIKDIAKTIREVLDQAKNLS
jgi:PAS domain S-box-containing protein